MAWDDGDYNEPQRRDRQSRQLPWAAHRLERDRLEDRLTKPCDEGGPASPLGEPEKPVDGETKARCPILMTEAKRSRTSPAATTSHPRYDFEVDRMNTLSGGDRSRGSRRDRARRRLKTALVSGRRAGLTELW